MGIFHRVIVLSMEAPRVDGMRNLIYLNLNDAVKSSIYPVISELADAISHFLTTLREKLDRAVSNLRFTE